MPVCAPAGSARSRLLLSGQDFNGPGMGMTSTARRRPTPAKGDMFELTLTLPNDPIAPGAARHTLDGLGDRLPQDVVERFQIVVSELVTNALLHAPDGADIRLEARLSGDALRVAVVQPGPTFEPDVGLGAVSGEPVGGPVGGRRQRRRHRVVRVRPAGLRFVRRVTGE